MKEAHPYIPEKYWEERLRANYSLTGVGHAGFPLEYNVRLYQARQRILNKFLQEKEIDCQGKKLLDIGAGTGFYIDFWKAQGIEHITGIDITTKAVDELQRIYPQDRFIKADFTEAQLPFDEKFDVITAFDIFFHIIDEDKFKQAIKNLRRFSHESTVLLIMDNFLKNNKPARGHQLDRTLEYYQEVLKNNAIEIKELRPVFFFMNAPIDIERMDSLFLRCLIRGMWAVNRIMIRLSRYLGPLGHLLAYLDALLFYHLDCIAIRFSRVGPSTKLLFCQLTSEKLVYGR